MRQIDRRADLLAEHPPTGPSDSLLNTRELAAWLRCSTQFLEIARSRGGGPPFLRLSARRVRYSKAAVLQWLQERSHQSTAEYPHLAGPGRSRKALAQRTEESPK